tara:strand:+ start:1426 stop:1629 length:204 start_codon:yes stop_codon:yes gene_type:complete
MALIDLVVIVGKKYKKKISKESTKLFYSITITYFTISLGFASTLCYFFFDSFFFSENNASLLGLLSL